MGFTQLKQPENNFIHSLCDTIVSIKNHLIINSIIKELNCLGENSQDNFSKGQIYSEYMNLMSIAKPIQGESILKIYGLFYSNDRDKVNLQKVFKDDPNANQAKKELTKIFPQDLLHSLRSRYIAHLDFDHQDIKSKGRQAISSDEVYIQYMSVLTQNNLDSSISFFETIYKSSAHNDDLTFLRISKAGAIEFWLRYLHGLKSLKKINFENIIKNLEKELYELKLSRP